jgi:16S rRNA (guanine527-N7)-methyltransferase
MQQEFQLIGLMDAVEKWNGKLNLISFKSRKELDIKHVRDSLSLLNVFELEGGQRVLDLGAGGGFPGLPLAIMAPETEFVLVDSTTKKMLAVQEIANELGLENVSTVAERAETLAHDDRYREAYGLVVARALAPLPTLLEYAAGFVCVNGMFVAYKSADYEVELEESETAMEKLGFEFMGPVEYALDEDMGARSLLIFQKIEALDDKYPRKSGTPKKKPL